MSLTTGERRARELASEIRQAYSDFLIGLGDDWATFVAKRLLAGKAPEGHAPLPEGVRCKCIWSWGPDLQGVFWCCSPEDKIAHLEGRGPSPCVKLRPDPAGPLAAPLSADADIRSHLEAIIALLVRCRRSHGYVIGGSAELDGMVENALYALAAASAEPTDQDLLAFGYAPGNYTSKCIGCGSMEWSGDKRAIRCRPCAVAAWGSRAAQKPAEGTA